MNNSQPCCESRAESISLLAAGCLTDHEERELQEHFAVCEVCHRRFEDVSAVCAALRAAKPGDDAELEQAIVRSQRNLLLPTRASIWNPRSVRFVISMLTACVLLFVAVSFFAGRPDADVAEQVAEVVPVRPLVSEGKPAAIPTLLALGRAAAESDESLDRLFASCSDSLVSESLISRTNYEELLR